MREVHDKGSWRFEHQPHYGQKRRGKKPAFYFVDFESSKAGKGISSRQRIKELARLNESMPDFITKADKLRFFKVYSKGNGLMERKRREFLKKIARRTLEKTNHLAALQQ